MNVHSYSTYGGLDVNLKEIERGQWEIWTALSSADPQVWGYLSTIDADTIPDAQLKSSQAIEEAMIV